MSLYSHNLRSFRLVAFTIGLLMVCGMCVSPLVSAAPNAQINYQGKLTNASNVSVPNAGYQIVFSLYTTDVGGSPIWTETHSGASEVIVTNGLFSVMLGSVNPFTGVDFNQTLYLGVTVEADSEMTPRKILGTVPAAFEAANAETVGGVASTSILRNDRIGSIATTSAATLLTLTQNGTGDIFNIFDGGSEVFTVLDGGNIGIGSSSPSSRLSVVGNTFLGGNLTATGTLAISGTSTLATTTISSSTITTLTLNNALSALSGGTGFNTYATGDMIYASGANTLAKRTIGTTGDVLSVIGGVPTWTATSTLGFASAFTTSAQLANLLSDETGSAGGGVAVFSISPTFTGTASFASTTNSGRLTVSGTSTLATTTIANLTVTGTSTLATTTISSSTIATLNLVNALAGTSGGTGLSTISQNQLLIGGAGNTWTQIATSSLGLSAAFTNSTQLAALLSDESGTGSVAYTNSPSFVTPNLGTPTTLIGTNITGTAAGLTAGTVTTNANLSGVVTSVGNTTSLGSFTSSNLLSALSDETGTGSVVFSISPTFTGTASFASTTNSGRLTVSGTSTLATTTMTDLTLAGAFRDGVTSAGTTGMILQTTGTSTRWIATSTLGLLSSAITAIGPTGQTQTGSTVTFATSTGSFNGLTTALTIVGAGNTLTYTPTITGTLNNAGLTNSSITFATGTTGTDINWTTSPVALGGTATLNIPNSSATARGLLTAADWTTFNGKISSSSLDTAAELDALLTDVTGVTGTGSLVLSASPTFTGTANFASTSNSGRLSVTGTSTLATTTMTDLSLAGAFRDSTNASGTSGMILQTTGTSTRWVDAVTNGADARSLGDGPYVWLIMGQSNATGYNGGGPNPASPAVRTWDGVTDTWGGSDITSTPWTRVEPNGNSGNNNVGLALAHRIHEQTAENVYLVPDFLGGTSIDEWVASGTSSSRYAAAAQKVADALASSELAGKTKIDGVIWIQGESDFADSYSTHLANVETLYAQLLAEDWFSTTTPFLIGEASSLYDSYQFKVALQQFANNTAYATLVSSKSRATSDTIHYTGPELFDWGYTTFWNALKSTPKQYSTPTSIFVNTLGQPAKFGDLAVLTPLGVSVGVGDVSVDYNLTVAGDALFGLTGSRVTVGNSLLVGETGLQAYYDTGEDAGVLQSAHQGTAFKDTLINPYGGNIGIGTTTPNARLTVSGTFLATGTSTLATTTISSSTITTLTLNNALSALSGGTGFNTYATGDMIYASGANTLAKRTIGTTGDVLSVIGGVPTWTATSTLGFASAFTTSAQLANLLSDETGSAGGGVAVFSNAPTFTGVSTFANLNVTGTSSFVGTSTFANNVFASSDGSSDINPRTFGIADFTTGEAGRFQFGDALNSVQSSFGGRMQLQSYWGVEILGGRQNLTAQTFTAGVANDPSLNVYAGVASNPIFVITASSSQTGNLQQWRNSAGTPISVVNASNNFGIGSSSPSNRLSVVGNTYLGGTLTATGTLTILGTSNLATTTISSSTIDTLTLNSALGVLSGGTGFNTYSTGDMIYASGANTLAKRTIGTTGDVLSVVGGVPTWVATSTLGISSGSTFSNSAQLAALLSDETGSAGGGVAVFSNAPTFTGVSTFAGVSTTNATTTNLVITSLTSGRIPLVSIDGQLIDSANFTVNNNIINAGVDIVPLVTLGSNIGSTTRRFANAWAGTLNVGTTTTWSIFTNADGRLSVTDAALQGGTERFSLGTNGNVGIGSSTPGSRLTVIGNTFLGGNLTATGTLAISGTSTLATTTISSSTITTLTLNNALSALSGGTGFNTYSTGDMIYASGANTLAKRTIGTTGDVLSVVGGVPTWVATSTLGISGGPALFTDGGATTYLTSLTDRLGIGTTTAGATLDVWGSLLVGTSSVPSLYVSTDTAGNPFVAIGTSTPRRAFEIYSASAGDGSMRLDEPSPRIELREGDAAADNRLWRIQANSQVLILGASNDALNVYNPFLSVARSGATPTSIYTPISASFGIGTATPAVQLAVQGTGNNTLWVQSNNTAGTSLVINNTSTSSRAYEFAVTGSSSAYGLGHFLFYNQTTSQGPLIINANGNTRIGHDPGFTATASSTLTVYGGTSIGTGYISTTAPTNGLIVEGNVGIGSSSPSSRLSVVGNTFLGGNLTATGTLAISGTSTLATTTISSSTITTLNLVNALAATSGGTSFNTYATGDMIYASGANTLAKRTIGTTGDVLSVVGGVPTWVATSSLGISGGPQLFTDGGATTYLTSLSDNLAIGTSTPTGSRLSVVGTTTITGNLFAQDADFDTLALSLPTTVTASDPAEILNVADNLGALRMASNTAVIATGDILANTENRSGDTLAISDSLLSNGLTATVSGNTLDVSRFLSPSGGSNVMTVTGALARFVDDCTGFSGGTCTSSNNGVEIIQSTNSNTGAALNITSSSTNGGLVFRANDTGLLTDTTPFVIDQTGNVGIGTSTPGSKLTVIGTATITGTTTLATTTIDGLVQMGTTSVASRFNLDVGGFNTAGTAGLNRYYTSTNAASGTVQFGESGYLRANVTATSTIVGSLFRVEDSTTFGNTIRGIEVQTNRGSNTRGENTALSGFARTFGVRGFTSADAGSVIEPAGGYFETGGTTQGNAIRGYSSSITSASLASLFQETSTFTGTGLQINLGNGTGSFTGKFLDLQAAGVTKFSVASTGATILMGDLSINSTNTDPADNNVVGMYLGVNGFASVNRSAGVAMNLGRSNDGSVLEFYSAGAVQGGVSIAGATVSYNAFTGSHFGLTGGVTYPQGTLLTLTGSNASYNNDETSEILYGMTQSSIENDPKIVGSYLSVLEPAQAESTSNPTLVMAVGNGHMWVADQGENIEAGDYLISSDVPGHAEKDTQSADVSYVIARASESIDWSIATQTIAGVKHKKITVFFENFDRPNINLATMASSTLDLANLSTENPTERFLAGLVDSLISWFGNAQNGIGSMYANVFNAHERICVDGECLDASDIRDLKNALQNGGSSNQAPAPAPAGDGSGENDGGASGGSESDPSTSPDGGSGSAPAPDSPESDTPPETPPAPDTTNTGGGDSEAPSTSGESGSSEGVTS